MQSVMDTFDVIVVGTGPGGATVAREMAYRSRRVLMLEWGDQDPVTGTLLQYLTRASLPGKGLMITNNLLGMLRGITTGGSSVFYYATAFEPPTEMLAKYGIDIAAQVDEIRRELPLAPLSPHLIGPMFSTPKSSVSTNCFPMPGHWPSWSRSRTVWEVA